MCQSPNCGQSRGSRHAGRTQPLPWPGIFIRDQEKHTDSIQIMWMMVTVTPTLIITTLIALRGARHCSKCCTLMNPFNFQGNSTKYAINIPILQMRKLRHRAIKQPAKGLMAKKGKNLCWNPGSRAAGSVTVSQ